MVVYKYNGTVQTLVNRLEIYVLCHPLYPQKEIMDILYDVFRLAIPVWTEDFSKALLSVGPLFHLLATSCIAFLYGEEYLETTNEC